LYNVITKNDWSDKLKRSEKNKLKYNYSFFYHGVPLYYYWSSVARIFGVVQPFFKIKIKIMVSIDPTTTILSMIFFYRNSMVSL